MTWYLPSGVNIANCIAAYAPKGAASYATSKVNLAHPGTYDASDGVAYPTWSAANGWNFVAPSSQYLTTGIIPENDQTWSAIIKFSSGGSVNDSRLFGYLNTGYGAGMFISPLKSYVYCGYCNGGYLGDATTDTVTSGILCVAGNKAYKNGVDQSISLPTVSGSNTVPVYIGCMNNTGVAQEFTTGYIQYFAIYDVVLSQAQITEITNSILISATYIISNTSEFTEALISPVPGDIFELRQGVYTGNFTVADSGTLANPIIIRPYGDGNVTIDGTFTYSNHVHVYDIDITDTRTDRYLVTTSVTMNGKGNCAYGCMLTQQHMDGINWFGSELANGGEVCENVFLLNGVRYGDDSGHGHSLYSHNDQGGRRLIARNSMYLNLGNYTLQLYSASNKTDDYSVIDNIFLGPIYCGGHFGPNNLIYQNNINVSSVSIAYGMGDHTCDNILIDGNTFIDTYSFTVGGAPGVLTNLVESNNIVYDGYLYGGYLSDPHAGYSFPAKPATLIKLTPFTKSVRWKGLLSIYNRDSANTVSVDFSGLLANGNYRLRNTQNMAESWDFTQLGAAVDVPMNFTSGDFIGDSYEPATTFPVFGAFVIESGDNPIYGDTTWGHKTGVTESNIRSYAVNWTGTGGISGINDAEKIGLHVGEYMVSEVVNTGVRTVELLQNNYDITGDDVNLDYRHGATEVACEAAAWNDYSVPFVSLGFVQIRLTSTL